MRAIETESIRVAKDSSAFSILDTPTDPELLKTRGSFFLVASFLDGLEEGVKEETVSKIRKAYFSSEGGILTALNRAVAVSEGKFKDLILAVVWGSILYLAKTDESAAWLYRKKLKRITFNKSASGFIQAQDIVILGSEAFGKEVELEEIEKAINEQDFNLLNKKISQKDSNALVILIKEQQEMSAGEVVNFLDSDKISYSPLKKSRFKPILKLIFKIIKKSFSFLFRLIKKLLSLRKPQRAIALRPQRRFKFRLVYLVVILGLALIFRVGFGFYQSSKAKVTDKFNSLASEIEVKIDEAVSLQSLNPVAAKALVYKAEQLFNEVKNLKGIDLKKVGSLEGKFEELKDKVNHRYKIANLPLYYDLSQLDKNALGTDIAAASSGLVVLDQNTSSLYLLDSRSREAKRVLNTEELSRAKKITADRNTIYILASQGVYKFNLDQEKLEKLFDKDSAWENVVDLSVWGGNIYLLDRGAKVVWKYTSGSSDKGEFVRSEELDGGRSLAVDGLVWVLKEGEVLKYLKGKKENFVLQDLKISLNDSSLIKSIESSSNIYILDRGNGRVLILDKNGVYQASYEAEQVREALSFQMDEGKKQLFILAKGKVFLTDLK